MLSPDPRNPPYLDFLVSNDKGATAHRLRLDVAQLTQAVRKAIDARLYRMRLTEFQVIVGIDVLKSCAIGHSEEIDLTNFHHREIIIDGRPVQLLGWAEGALIVPA